MTKFPEIPLIEALESRVLVCDGAMGTMLYAKGVFINKSFDALNVAQPDLVLVVHQEYVRAGADIIETNTFGANRMKLGSFGLGASLHEISIVSPPVQRPIPIWFGGSSDAVVRRAARLGDGWMPIMPPDDQAAAKLAALSEHSCRQPLAR